MRKDSKETPEKGKGDWPKGKKRKPFTAEHRKNLSEASKGKKKGPRSESSKQKQRESMKGKYAGENHPLWGKHRSEETKQKIRESKIGEKSHLWKIDGDHYEYWHNKARKSFRKENCSRCGMTNEESIKKYKRRLYMHCTGDPKDYSLQEVSNWETYCMSCHQIIECQLRKLKKEAKIKLHRR